MIMILDCDICLDGISVLISGYYATVIKTTPNRQKQLLDVVAVLSVHVWMLVCGLIYGGFALYDLYKSSVFYWM